MSDLMRYKIDRIKRWLKRIIADYLEKKVEKEPKHAIRFKKPLSCYVWVLDRNWDEDCVYKDIYGIEGLTHSGYARPSDIDKLGDIIKILFKVLFFGIRR